VIDRRKEFTNNFWRVGQVLKTKGTERWSPEHIAELNEREHREAYVFFYNSNEGRSRVLVHRFETAARCFQAVKLHNQRLNERHPG